MFRVLAAATLGCAARTMWPQRHADDSADISEPLARSLPLRSTFESGGGGMPAARQVFCEGTGDGVKKKPIPAPGEDASQSSSIPSNKIVMPDDPLGRSRSGATAAAAGTVQDAHDAGNAADPNVPPVRLVVVGGGYAGSRLAYQLDSVFDVTLIDTKNFMEFKPDLVPLLCSPWTEKHDEALGVMHALHRFYMRRANVVTDRVTNIDIPNKSVTLESGSSISFDLLALTLGERTAFPFSTQQRTLAQREAELKNFNKFISDPACKKIAVVGGGVMGSATAYELATNFPDKEVQLFQSGPCLMPSMPAAARFRAKEVLSQAKNLTTHFNSRVTHVTSSSSLPIRAGEQQPLSTSTGLTASASPSWWSMIVGAFGGHSSVSSSAPTSAKFTCEVDHLSSVEINTQSVFLQVLFHPTGGQRATNFSTGEIESHSTFNDFDYVFVCSGNTPRVDEPLVRDSPVLRNHMDHSGRIIVSKYMQLFGMPHIYAVGRCNYFPWVRSVGNSDLQSRTLFRNLLTMASLYDASKKQAGGTGAILLQSNMAITSKKMAFPRLIMKFGPHDAIGSTAWAGTILGPPAVKEQFQDKQFFMREFNKPMFFKLRDTGEVRRAFDHWIERVATDVADFVVD